MKSFILPYPAQNHCQHGTLSGRGRDFIFCVCSVVPFAWEEIEGGCDNSQRGGGGGGRTKTDDQLPGDTSILQLTAHGRRPVL